MSALPSSCTNLRDLNADLSRALGSEIKVTISADRNVFWYRGLYTEDYRNGRCESAVEGVWTSYGTSGFLDLNLRRHVC